MGEQKHLDGDEHVEGRALDRGEQREKCVGDHRGHGGAQAIDSLDARRPGVVAIEGQGNRISELFEE